MIGGLGFWDKVCRFRDLSYVVFRDVRSLESLSVILVEFCNPAVYIRNKGFSMLAF